MKYKARNSFLFVFPLISGNPVTELGHTIFNKSFFDNRDHGGFLYIRSTFQCTQKLILPNPPFLFGILLQKWETPWAKVFPIRLLLRLGAEYRCKICSLIGFQTVQTFNNPMRSLLKTLWNIVISIVSFALLFGNALNLNKYKVLAFIRVNPFT